jgi:hypothetical protein
MEVFAYGKEWSLMRKLTGEHVDRTDIKTLRCRGQNNFGTG